MIIYVASNNAHKVTELNQLIQCATLESASDLGGMPIVPEDTGSFEGNARQKAQALQKQADQDVWVLADDSGLCVDALDGAPGITSARYAGEQATDEANTWKLLREMEGVPEPLRSARFICALVLLGPWGEDIVFTGHCPGTIAESPDGEGGFGYDPVFIPDGYSKSFASLPPEVKEQISHRANAVNKLCNWLEARA